MFILADLEVRRGTMSRLQRHEEKRQQREITAAAAAKLAEEEKNKNKPKEDDVCSDVSEEDLEEYMDSIFQVVGRGKSSDNLNNDTNYELSDETSVQFDTEEGYDCLLEPLPEEYKVNDPNIKPRKLDLRSHTNVHLKNFTTMSLLKKNHSSGIINAMSLTCLTGE